MNPPIPEPEQGKLSPPQIGEPANPAPDSLRSDGTQGTEGQRDKGTEGQREGLDQSPAKYVTTGEFGKLFNPPVSSQTVRNLIDAGMPTLGKAGRGARWAAMIDPDPHGAAMKWCRRNRVTLFSHTSHGGARRKAGRPRKAESAGVAAGASQLNLPADAASQAEALRVEVAAKRARVVTGEGTDKDFSDLFALAEDQGGLTHSDLDKAKRVQELKRYRLETEKLAGKMIDADAAAETMRGREIHTVRVYDRVESKVTAGLAGVLKLDVVQSRTAADWLRREFAEGRRELNDRSRDEHAKGAA